MSNNQYLSLSTVSFAGLVAGSLSLVAPAIAVESKVESKSVPVQSLNQLELPASRPDQTGVSPTDHLAVPQAIAQSMPAAEQKSGAAQLSGLQTGERNPMAQVTSVSQLSDVKPTDWAFQALQSLVERYGCIVGYPDKKYRGNQALTRYEFAAGLNACMDRISELIASATADLVKKEDLAALQKLQEEFAAEMATLRGRVDALEARTATLEKQQFSTTTKLSGEVIFSLSSAYGAYPGERISPTSGRFRTSPAGATTTGGLPGRDANVVFNDRVRLKLLTSFSGKDLLITGLQAFNFGGGLGTAIGAPRRDSLSGTLGYADGVFGTASNARLAFEPQFGATNPSNLGNAPGQGNSIGLYKLLYIFPVVNKVTAFVGTAAEADDAFPTVVPFYGEGQEGISRFGQMNPVLRISGGTSGIGLASAAGVIFNISDAIDFRALYGSVNANLPNNLKLAGGTPLGAGLFGGSYVAAAQLTVKPLKSLDIALNYAHSYHQINILGLGEAGVAVGAIGGIPATTPVTLNSLGATAAWRITPNVTLTGFFFYSFVDAVTVDASTNFISYMGGIHFKDVLTKGSTFGLLFGSPPHRDAISGLAVRPENSVPYHLEAYYKYKLSDNISITPGVFVIFNPEGFSGNRTVYVPVIRTTFTF